MKIIEIVGEKIAKSGQNVQEKVVDILVNKEVDKRVEVVLKALTKIETLEKELKTADKEDVFTYVEGERKGAMSQKAYENLQKLKGQYEGLRKAFDTALDKNDNESYNKLNGLLGGNKQESPTKAEPQA